MKKLYFLLIFSLIFSFVRAQPAFMDQGLSAQLADAQPGELIPIMIELSDVVDIGALKAEFAVKKIPVNRRAQIVMERLKAKAAETQPAVIAFIESSGMVYADLETLWIGNFIALKASPALIYALSDHEAVGFIGLNAPQFSLIAPEKGKGGQPKSVGGTETGLVAIGAPEMWAMGYTGMNRLALTFDTGVWPDHPAFKNRFLVNRMPYGKTWYGYDSPVPADKSDSHGTHVSGIMLGLDTATADTIGVAMNAYLIATDPIVQNLADVKPLSEIALGYQWALNPDGDETTSDDIPDVINNSWGRDNTVIDQDWSVCPELWVPVVTAVEAAGIANVFSAGNEGPNASTIGVPHNTNVGLVNSFTVGAVTAVNTGYYPIAEFSSRGPSLCGGEGSLLIKPEVSAPGVNVRSSVGHNAYDLYSGTSMASPHVSGAVLLLKEAFPYLSGEDLLLALYYSATDLGAPGEDNTFGMGIINVKAAYDLLAEDYVPVPPAPHTYDLELVSIPEPATGVVCIDPEAPGVEPLAVVRNNGTEDVTGISFTYSLNGDPELTYTVEDLVLAAGSDTEIPLPYLNISTSGPQELYCRIDTIAGEFDTYNNHNIARWVVLPMQPLDVPYVFTEDFSEGFEEQHWTVENPDGLITWDTLNVIQADNSTGDAAWMNFKSYQPGQGQRDNLYSPMLSAAIEGGFTKLVLDFDLFYRHKSSDLYRQDTLSISLVTSCFSGDTGGPQSTTEIFKQGGDSLYSVPDGDSYALPQDSAEWRHISVNYMDLNTSELNFYLVFQGINRRGNHLLIDNIHLKIDYISGLEHVDPSAMILYPNPATGRFTLKASLTETPDLLEIYDIFGKKVRSYKVTDTQAEFDVAGLARGMYLVSISRKGTPIGAERLVIQ